MVAAWMECLETELDQEVVYILSVTQLVQKRYHLLVCVYLYKL